jgi:hypothetical protein
MDRIAEPAAKEHRLHRKEADEQRRDGQCHPGAC